MLLYLGVAIASIAASAAIYLQSNARMAGISAAGMMESFVAEVNSNANLQSSRFYAYIPPMICNAKVSGYSIHYLNETYYFYRKTIISILPNCSNGGIEEVHTNLMQNGSLMVN